jgi:hypothetical protein
VDISWPASNTSQKFTGVKPNQFIQISEFAKEYKVLTPKRFHFENKTRLSNNQAGQE